MSAAVSAPSAWSASPVATDCTYRWDGLALRSLQASSTAASATIEYLHFGEDRPFAAAYTVTRGTETTGALFQLMSNDHGDVVALADEAGGCAPGYARPLRAASEVEVRLGSARIFTSAAVLWRDALTCAAARC